MKATDVKLRIVQTIISGQVFYTYFYNHARRFRLGFEKLQLQYYTLELPTVPVLIEAPADF